MATPRIPILRMIFETRTSKIQNKNASLSTALISLIGLGRMIM